MQHITVLHQCSTLLSYTYLINASSFKFKRYYRSVKCESFCAAFLRFLVSRSGCFRGGTTAQKTLNQFTALRLRVECVVHKNKNHKPLSCDSVLSLDMVRCFLFLIVADTLLCRGFVFSPQEGILSWEIDIIINTI